MKKLKSIQEIHKLYTTSGSSPILVTCDDFNEWVCKYDRQTNNLFNELISSEFAKIWKINTPESALVLVNKEHVPLAKYPALHPHLFNKECFGTKLLENSIDVNLSAIPLFKEPSFINKIQNKSDFLKIALFDIWLSNEDRHYNNNNLLIHSNSNNFKFFFAIDHVCIFNSSTLHIGLTELTEDDTIINTDIAALLFKDKKKLTAIVDNLDRILYLCTKVCEEKLDEILELVPLSWGIDIDLMRENIKKNLFSNHWKQSCITTFRSYVQTFISN